MSDLPPFLYDVQTGVLRGVNAPIVTYLFFRITDRQKFIEQLPVGPDPEPDQFKGNGIGLRATVFHSEGWRIEHRRKKAEAERTGGAPRRSGQSSDAADDPELIPFANVAFTYSGLRALGVHDQTLQSFPEVFREGMARRAQALGDTGPAAPELWDGYLGSREIHGVAWGSVFYPKLPTGLVDLAVLYEALMMAVTGAIPLPLLPIPWPRPKSPVAAKTAGLKIFDFNPAPIDGADVLHYEFGYANYRDNDLKARVEHFGFHDGISQPYAEIGLKPPPPGGGTPRAANSWAPAARGEILLGYPNEDNNVQRLPANKALRSNGTFMVFRKLEQDVVGFRNFMKRHDNSGVPDRLASQMIGRWPDGTALVRHPDGPEGAESRPSTQTINDFRYQVDDPLGARCPIGAHIRRANPRDTNDRDEARRHRLFRRSMSYGGPLLPEASTGDGVKRGLLFITMQSAIDRQFETVQANWLGRGELVGQAGALLDPLIGLHAGRVGDAFHPAGCPAPVAHLPRFVTLRGGDYFFVPSFTALAKMRENYAFAPDDAGAPLPVDAIGSILPSRTDSSGDLIALGKRLLANGAPSATILPPITTTPFPGGPPVQIPTAVVGQHGYVTEVLCHDVGFSSRMVDMRSRGITGGQGLLVGMPNNPERAKRLKVLHDALQLMGPLPVSQVARHLTKGVLDRVLPTGRLDVVANVGRVVPVLAAGVLFGVLGPGFVSPTAIATRFGRFDVTDMPDDWLRTLPAVEDYAKPLATMQAWTRMSFLQIFINVANATEIAQPAERAAREFIRHIDVLIQRARQTMGPDKPRNLLEALVRVPLDPTDTPDPGRHMRLLLAEFTPGAVETVNAALTNSIDYLLDHEREVRQVLIDYLNPRRLDRSKITLGDLIDMLSDEQLDILLYEILRFAPMAPIAFRFCEQPYQLGTVAINPGTVVCLVPAAAMIDPRVFPQPDKIRFDRPLNSYLHFGAGLHQCAGQRIVDPFVFPIAMPLLRETFRAIARLPKLRRAAGIAGTRQHIFPLLTDGLTVRFESPAGS